VIALWRRVNLLCDANIFKGIKTMTQRMLAKTATHWVCRISVASTLGFLPTGNLQAALGTSFLAPSVQAGVFNFHEKAWEGQGDQNLPAPYAQSALLPYGRL
jgi:uncharacterized membrane protein